MRRRNGVAFVAVCGWVGGLSGWIEWVGWVGGWVV